MKIAAVTEDGVKLSSHFGTAPSYRVLTIDEGTIVSDEIIEKTHNSVHRENNKHEAHHDRGGHSGMRFFQSVKNCQVLLLGGIGEPAYKRALSLGFEVIMTGGKIDTAVEAYLSGELVSDLRRVHKH